MGEGTRQAMEYEEELVHNVQTATQNAVVSIVKKVEDNILCVMTAPVITVPSATLKVPAANPLSTLLRAPNALIVKQVRMPTSRLKVAKPWPELAKVRTQQ